MAFCIVITLLFFIWVGLRYDEAKDAGRADRLRVDRGLEPTGNWRIGIPRIGYRRGRSGVRRFRTLEEKRQATIDKREKNIQRGEG